MAYNSSLEERISLAELDAQRKKEEAKGALNGGEHCFRGAHNWYRLNMGYTNPFNLGTVHAELLLLHKLMLEHLLEQKKSLIFEAMKDHHVVFYGVGVGDTEILFIDWLLKAGKADLRLSGLDVNREFLENFDVALLNRLHETHLEVELQYRKFHALFEQVTLQDLHINDMSTAHICLGGTIGNFKDQEGIRKHFEAVSSPGDTLILGLQLKTHIETLYKKYRNNPLFEEFVLNYIPQEQRARLHWELEQNTGTITAVHKGIEVFRTTKYDTEELAKGFEKQKFRLDFEEQDAFASAAIQVYTRY